MITQTSLSNVSTPEESRANLIRKTAHDFGSLFVSMMIKEMRKGSFENDFMPQSFGQKLYIEMLDEKYAEQISAHSLQSFNDLIVKQLEASESSTGFSALSSIKNNLNSQRFAEFNTGNSATADVSADYLHDKVSKWTSLIENASKMFNIDSDLIKAVIAKESSGNQNAVSPAGAKGLMQLMDSTALELGVTNSFSPEENIAGGTKYLAEMLKKFKGNVALALASYNAGPSAVEKYNGVPPYRETQDYVRDVLRYKQLLSDNKGK
ncbi:MAG TPA: transglycosylase SLT domain-containing protein [Chitinispirillaceae bacterium]|nr:transglycosylase SLT domain-containing protein [Chitinispirillaceae bacterium]